MPTNVTAEYNAAELEYSRATTIAEKIKALFIMPNDFQLRLKEIEQK